VALDYYRSLVTWTNQIVYADGGKSVVAQVIIRPFGVYVND
jgi:hypothetical protein